MTFDPRNVFERAKPTSVLGGSAEDICSSAVFGIGRSAAWCAADPGPMRRVHRQLGPGSAAHRQEAPHRVRDTRAVSSQPGDARASVSLISLTHLQLGNAIVGAAEPPTKLAVDILHHHHIRMDVGP